MLAALLINGSEHEHVAHPGFRIQDYLDTSRHIKMPRDLLGQLES